MFPNHLIANNIFKKLIDHRLWRLTDVPAIEDLSKTKKRRKHEAMDQVPTSIADLAHVTRDLKGKVILNWDRFEERDWATVWNENIWHCNEGFRMRRGFRLDGYVFPSLTESVRSSLEWEEDLENEPPADEEKAGQRHKEIWERLHEPDGPKRVPMRKSMKLQRGKTGKVAQNTKVTV
jgi:hypothetical protein